jgi:hypothetical protein
MFAENVYCLSFFFDISARFPDPIALPVHLPRQVYRDPSGLQFTHVFIAILKGLYKPVLASEREARLGLETLQKYQRKMIDNKHSQRTLEEHTVYHIESVR